MKDFDSQHSFTSSARANFYGQVTKTLKFMFFNGNADKLNRRCAAIITTVCGILFICQLKKAWRGCVSYGLVENRGWCCEWHQIVQVDLMVDESIKRSVHIPILDYVSFVLPCHLVKLHHSFILDMHLTSDYIDTSFFKNAPCLAMLHPTLSSSIWLEFWEFWDIEPKTYLSCVWSDYSNTVVNRGCGEN